MKVQCPQCNETHTVNPDRIPETGATAKCKACGAPFRIEKETKPPDQADQTTCPKCGHTQLKADTCKYCGVIFNKAKQPTPPPPPYVKPEEAETRPEPDPGERPPAPPPNRTSQPKTFLYIIIAAVIIGLAWMGYSKYSEAKYIQNLSAAVANLLDTSQTCIEMCEKYREEWKTAIEGGKDFNLALISTFNDFKEGQKINAIEGQKEAVIQSIKALSKPPAGYQLAFQKLVDLYGAYSEIYGLASSPSGSLQSFSMITDASQTKITRLASELLVMVP